MIVYHCNLTSNYVNLKSSIVVKQSTRYLQGESTIDILCLEYCSAILQLLLESCGFVNCNKMCF